MVKIETDFRKRPDYAPLSREISAGDALSDEQARLLQAHTLRDRGLELRLVGRNAWQAPHWWQVRTCEED